METREGKSVGQNTDYPVAEEPKSRFFREEQLLRENYESWLGLIGFCCIRTIPQSSVMAGHTKGFYTRTPQKFTCCVEIPTVNSPKSRSPHSSQNTMLLATPPITLKGSMNSLLTPKSPSKLAMLNNNGSPKSNGNSNPMYHSPGNNHSRSGMSLPFTSFCRLETNISFFCSL